MNTSKFFMITAVLMLVSLFTARSQSKVVMITQNDDSTSVFVDTLNNNASEYAFFFDEDFDNIHSKLDSFMHVQRSNIDSVMKVMAIKLDSMQQNISMFSFDIGDDFFNNMIPSDSVVNNMMNVNMDMKIEVDTLADGTVVKNIVVTGFGDNSANDQKVTISTNSPNSAIVLNGSEDDENDVLSAIPVSDLHILKKAGFSASLFSEEPLEFKDENVNIERKNTDKSDILEIEFKADLPSKGKATVTLIDKNGSKVDEEKYKNTHNINVKYKLDGESVPYYIIVQQNKKAWAKKIQF